MTKDRLLRYATAAVPRYTSYPTAAQFNDGVGEADFRRWLAGIGAGAALSLYVHIPFCESLCWYCGCHTTVPNGYDRVARYLAHLEREIDLVAAATPDHAGVTHLHFGGGTPTYLRPADFAALIARLKARFAFSDDAQIAVEIDPRTLDDPMVAALVQSGVNRVSLGVQDFSPEVQRLIHRVQPYRMVAEAVRQLRAAGIDAVSFDLIYGLPAQTVEGVAHNAERAAELEPDRLAVFGYAHVPWFKKHQRAIDEAMLPDTAARMAQVDGAAAALVAAGYRAVGFDHFARPADSLARACAEGRLQRNFQGYTEDAADALIAFGASAISTLRDGFAQNAPHLGQYGKMLDAGRLPVVRGTAVDREDRMRAESIARLMCDFRLDMEAVAIRHGFAPDALDDAFAPLAPLVADGLVALSGRRLALTEDGRRFVRNAAYCLDAASQRRAGRHSQAV